MDFLITRNEKISKNCRFEFCVVKNFHKFSDIFENFGIEFPAAKKFHKFPEG